MVLEVDTVTKRYGPVTALAGVSFSVREGEIVGLVGANGAGKTTAIRAALGLLRPDAAFLARYRLRRLRLLCARPAEYSPFFAHYFSGVDTRRMSLQDFDALPILDKARMMSDFDVWNAAGLRREELLAFARENDRHRDYSRWYKGRYSVGLSSGTSGSSGLTVYAKKEVTRSVFRFLARNGLPRGLKHHRIMFALRTSVVAFGEANRFGWMVKHVDYRVPMPRVVREINDLRLNILAGSPTFLLELAPHAAEIHHSIDAVVSYAEILDEGARSILALAFHAPVHQIYACSEGYIAASCPRGTLHLNEDLLYRLNDMIELDPVPCACGSGFRAVRRVLGRADDALVLLKEDGTRSILYADYVCRAIIAASDLVGEYRVVQTSLNDVEVVLDIPDPQRRTDAIGKVRESLRDLLAGYRHVRLGIRADTIGHDRDHKLKRVTSLVS
jgi:phenylacetate-coenzyme A ligase PaaK-like adenylate-forming protein